MPIYTRTGDKGHTSLFDGSRVLKHNIRVDAYGTIDELNSLIGAVIAHRKKSTSQRISTILEEIQHDLLDIGSALAFTSAFPVPHATQRAKVFEKIIDELTAALPELKDFILPGGSPAGSLLHVARTVARRAERKITTLQQKEEIDEGIVIYVNRLSDLLFTLARYVNFEEKIIEKKWIKK